MTSTTASTVTIRRSAALERKVLRAVRLQWVLAAGIFWVPVFLATATMYLFAVYARAGWAMDGPSLAGATLNNITLLFEGPADARVLLDDFEVRE